MDQSEFNPEISAELVDEIDLECSVSIKGLKKNGKIHENDEFVLEAHDVVNEMMLNGIEEAVVMLEDENPGYRLATVKSVNACTAREKRTVCFVRA